MPCSVWLYEFSPPPSPSSHQPHSPFGLFLLLLLTFPLLSLACLLCVCAPCDLCSVGLSADTSISRMFISAATPTRCVPPLPVQPGNSGDFSPSLRSLAARFPLPPLLVCGSTLLKHERLLVAVFVHFPGALLIVRLPPPLCSVPCPQQITSPLSSSLTTHLPWPLLEAGAVQGRASGGGARPEMVPIQCKRTSCTPCPPSPFYFLPHAVTPFPPSFFSFAPWSGRCVLHVRACVRACVRAGAAGASSPQQACAPLTLHACVCVCAFPRDVFSA